MLRKYKILLLIIVLTAGGVISILGVWLSGSYNNREELFMSNAERSLFNVVQDFYQQERANQNIKMIESVRKGRIDSRLIDLIKSMYPAIDKNKVWSAWDSLLAERYLSSDTSHRRHAHVNKNEGPRQIMPAFLLSRIDFNEQAIVRMTEMLRAEMEERKIPADFELKIVARQREKIEEWEQLNIGGVLLTRPILVNPDQKQYLIAEFERPWKYLLTKMSWQVLFSVLLVCTLIGSFFYLMKTISRQNKLALMRKSFVNNMTHELKTPISTVMAAIEAVQRFGAKDDREKSLEYIEIARKELEHLAYMVERVLEIDVDENQKLKLIRSEVDLVSLARECIDTMLISVDREVDIQLLADKDEVVIIGDQAHLRNVFNNLIDNAIKYSDEPIKVEINIIQSAGETIFSVRDFGKGIALEHQKSIFEMFFRVPEGNLHNVKGFGLGLSYVKQIVLLHGGQIFVESQLGKGSKFTIKFPNNFDG